MHSKEAVEEAKLRDLLEKLRTEHREFDAQIAAIEADASCRSSGFKTDETQKAGSQRRDYSHRKQAAPRYNRLINRLFGGKLGSRHLPISNLSI